MDFCFVQGEFCKIGKRDITLIKEIRATNLTTINDATTIQIGKNNWDLETYGKIFKQMLKISAFYLETQKSFIPKKNLFQAVFNIKTKSFVY